MFVPYFSIISHTFVFFLCFTRELTFFYNAWLLPYVIDCFVDDEPFPSTTEEIVHNWGEFDKDVPLTSELSRRLAVCNMDWDNITATDIFVVFNSFKSLEGTLLSVKVIQIFFLVLRLLKRWIEEYSDIKIVSAQYIEMEICVCLKVFHLKIWNKINFELMHPY